LTKKARSNQYSKEATIHRRSNNAKRTLRGKRLGPSRRLLILGPKEADVVV
jgi:hypothetical protein